MKKNLVTFALALACAALAPAAFAQHPENTQPHGESHGGPEPAGEGHGEGHGPGQHHEGHGEHGLHEGFHAPTVPFNLANPSPAPITETHDGQTVEVKGPPPFLWGTVLNFAILVAILYTVVRRQVNPALAANRAAIETEINEARRLHSEAKDLHQEYTDKLARLDEEIAAIKADMVKQGEAERERIVAEARARAERMNEEGRQMIEQEMKNTREELRREAVLAAAASAEETVRKTINAGDQQRLVDDFIKGLDAAPREGRPS